MQDLAGSVCHQSTQYTAWKPREQTYYWVSDKEKMKSVHLISNTGSCKNCFDIYQCAEDGTKPKDKMIVVKHQQLYAIKRLKILNSYKIPAETK